MDRFLRYGRCFYFLRVFLLGFVLLSLMPKSLYAGPVCKPSSIRKETRFPIVFHPSRILFGSSIHRVEAWSFNGKRWSQATLQIDEVNGDGSYVLEEGIPYTKDTDDGLLDGNDELSIPGEFLGGVPTDKSPQFPPGSFTASRWVHFCDTENQYYGSIWVGGTTGPAKSILKPGIFIPQAGEVLSRSYRYKFRQDQPMLMGKVLVKKNGHEEEVFSGNDFVMPLIPKLFFLPSFFFGEQDFTSEIECWRSGPVRSIVAVGSKLKKFFSLIDLHLFSELVFYEDYFQIPTKIEFVFDPSSYFKSGTGLAYVLRYKEGLEWSLNTNLKPLPPKPTSIEEAGTAISHSPTGAFSVLGRNKIGSFAARVRVDEKALKMAPPPYLVQKPAFQSRDLIKNWSWLEKSQGDLGVFIDISGVEKGTYDFALDVALSNQADDGFADFRPLTAFWSE